MCSNNMAEITTESLNAVGTTEALKKDHYYCIFGHEDKSLVWIAGNIESEQFLTFISKKLGTAQFTSAEGNESVTELKVENVEKEFSCFYSCLKKNIATISKASTIDSLESVVTTEECQYIMCLLSSGLTLDLFRPELQTFCANIMDSLPLEMEIQQGLNTEIIKSKLSAWPHHTVHYISRCLERFEDVIGNIIYAAVANMDIDIKSHDNELASDIQRFSQLFSLSDYLNTAVSRHELSVANAKDLDFKSHKTELASFDNESFHFSYSKCPVYCSNLANNLLQCRTAPHRVKQHIESFKCMILQDLNLFLRILNEAEQNHYALYRTYIFLSQLDYATIILMHAKAHLMSNDAAMEVIQILEEHLNLTITYNFSSKETSSGSPVV